MMKKVFVTLLILLLPLDGLFAENLTFHGSQFSRKVLLRHPGGYISLFAISEQMGAEIHWDKILNKVEICRSNKKISFLVNSALFFFQKSKVRTLTKPSRVVRGEVFVPIDSMRLIYKELSLPGEIWVIKKHKDRSVISQPKRGVEYIAPLKKKSGRISVVFIDAGHGGRDPGAVGRGGLRESVVVLHIARLVAARLRAKFPGLKVILTRRFNRTVTLSQRATIANRYIKKGYKGIFVSIHANASFSRYRRGFETYYLSPIASNAEARSTAAIENGALDLDVNKTRRNDMSNILSKMLVEEYRRESTRMARYIQAGLKRKIGSQSKDRGIKKANFFVMRRVFMPSVLVEVGFVTSNVEARLLNNSKYRSRIAAGIAAGVGNFLHFFKKKN